MKVLLKQKSKDYYSAEFDLIQGEEIIGSAILQDKMTSIKIPIITIKVQNKEIIMKAVKKREKGQSLCYQVLSGDNECGFVCRKKHKTGFLSTEYRPTLEWNGNIYEWGSNGIGTSELEGMVKYDNGYDVTIYNDMHNFEIECNEDIEELYRTLVLTMYKYATGRTGTSTTSLYYQPGVKASKSVQKVKVRWKNKK